MNRNILYTIYIIVGVSIFFSPLKQLLGLSFENELYSHFPLIPLVSLYFLFIERKSIFRQIRWQPYVGLPLILISIGIYGLAHHFSPRLNLNDFLSINLFAVVLWINGGFLTFYGLNAYKNTLFPLLFLIFMIPIPTAILDPVIRFLQVWSANAVHLVYQILNVPVHRDGMVFQLPGIAIEVAKECSGIRSTLALFITSIIAGHFFLRAKWNRAILCLMIIPATIIKNAIRISTLSLLAVYVDPSWLTNSWLHRGGGIVFFLIALVLLTPFLWLLRQAENRNPRA